MCHVLIIEDEALIALNIQCVLEENGAKTFDVASTEEEAVAAAIAHRPDVITSDVRLKRGTGPGAVRTIQALLGKMQVIFITATPSLSLGKDGGVVMCKPLDEEKMARAFREMAPAPA